MKNVRKAKVFKIIPKRLELDEPADNNVVFCKSIPECDSNEESSESLFCCQILVSLKIPQYQILSCDIIKSRFVEMIFLF